MLDCSLPKVTPHQKQTTHYSEWPISELSTNILASQSIFSSCNLLDEMGGRRCSASVRSGPFQKTETDYSGTLAGGHLDSS